MNKYNRLRRYFILYNTFELASRLFFSDEGYYSKAKYALISDTLETCNQRINIYAEVMEDDPIYTKIKDKCYFNLYLYNRLNDYIKDNDKQSLDYINRIVNDALN